MNIQEIFDNGKTQTIPSDKVFAEIRQQVTDDNSLPFEVAEALKTEKLK